MVTRLNGRDALINYLKGDINVESDCEDDLTAVGGAASEPKEEQTCAVLTTGSFSAYVSLLSRLRLRNNKRSSWRALFFYRCTDVISFAPLRSQGVDARSNYVRGRMGTATPPPCSPKSIYVLASLARKHSIEHLIYHTDRCAEARNSASL